MSDIVEVSAGHVQHFTGRDWVFQAIDRWLADPHGKRVFSLTGGPGSGKTAIATRLVQISNGDTPPPAVSHIGRGFLSALHFCQVGNDTLIDPLRFVEALSTALAQRFPLFAEALTQARQADPCNNLTQQIDRV
jgi:hypothetical protein